jgi:hypothetical protein
MIAYVRNEATGHMPSLGGVRKRKPSLFHAPEGQWIGQCPIVPHSATTTACPAAGPPLSAAPISQTSSRGRLPCALDSFPPCEGCPAGPSHLRRTICLCGEALARMRRRRSITICPNATLSPAVEVEVEAHHRLGRSIYIADTRYSRRTWPVHPPSSFSSPSSGKQHPQKETEVGISSGTRAKGVCAFPALFR